EGYDDRTFRPAAPVTRQAGVAFLTRLMDLPDAPAGPPTFSDVSPSHPFAAEIEAAAAAGMVEGYDDGTFRPGTTMTRQAFAAFLHRAAGSPAVPSPPDPTFPDVGFAHPFSDEIEWLAHTGLTDGYPDGTFRPAALVTRQAAAAQLHRYADAFIP
ncbi:hypothetical protein B7486_60040, partial [cyanobacterium TDX16]